MKILLDVKDNKARFILELLQNLPFVKAEHITPYKAEVMSDLKKSVDEMNLIKKGKLKARSAKTFLDEL